MTAPTAGHAERQRRRGRAGLDGRQGRIDQGTDAATALLGLQVLLEEPAPLAKGPWRAFPLRGGKTPGGSREGPLGGSTMIRFST